jgi:hypothetical protein
MNSRPATSDLTGEIKHVMALSVALRKDLGGPMPLRSNKMHRGFFRAAGEIFRTPGCRVLDMSEDGGTGCGGPVPLPASFSSNCRL